jgi:hypothetical protein
MPIKCDCSQKNSYKTNRKIGWLVVWSSVGVLVVGSLVFFLCGKNTRFSDNVSVRLAARGEKIPSLIKHRNHPLHLDPISGLEDCVTDEQILISLIVSRMTNQ